MGGVVLGHSNYPLANLSNANLSGANLARAELIFANLKGAGRGIIGAIFIQQVDITTAF